MKTRTDDLSLLELDWPDTTFLEEENVLPEQAPEDMKYLNTQIPKQKKCKPKLLNRKKKGVGGSMAREIYGAAKPQHLYGDIFIPHGLGCPHHQDCFTCPHPDCIYDPKRHK